MAGDDVQITLYSWMGAQSEYYAEASSSYSPAFRRNNQLTNNNKSYYLATNSLLYFLQQYTFEFCRKIFLIFFIKQRERYLTKYFKKSDRNSKIGCFTVWREMGNILNMFCEFLSYQTSNDYHFVAMIKSYVNFKS